MVEFVTSGGFTCLFLLTEHIMFDAIPRHQELQLLRHPQLRPSTDLVP